MSSWIGYSLVRLGIFGAIFLLLYTVGVAWWVSLIFATVVSFASSYIFLRSWREQMSSSLTKRQQRPYARDNSDEAVEDHV